jgi:hypothetical protein
MYPSAFFTAASRGFAWAKAALLAVTAHSSVIANQKIRRTVSPFTNAHSEALKLRIPRPEWIGG